MAAAEPAPAAPGLVRIIQDDGVLVYGDGPGRDLALDEIRATNADVVRTILREADVRSGMLPRFDAFVDAVNARGLRVLMTLTPDPRGSPVAFSRLARMAGRRYGGRVWMWTLVNEPNSPQHLLPQYRGRRPVSPGTYRRMVRAGLHGLDAAGIPSRRVILGELLGTGSDFPGERAPVRPLAFTRAFFCLDRRDRPHDCPDPPRALDIAGWSFHPYPLRGGPLAKPRSPLDVTVTHLGPLRRTLDAAWRAGRTSRRLSLWDTEGGVQTDPPDPLLGVPPHRHARFLNEIEWRLWRAPTVRSVAQYLWRDEPRLDRFQSGLRYLDASPKPALAAWGLPLHVRRANGGVEVWARLPRGATTGELLLDGLVERRLTAGRDGTVLLTTRAAAGTQIRVRAGGRLSRAASVPRRSSRSRRR